MKNKLFKTVRPMLSIAVAVAVFAVSLFSAVSGISFSADAATVEDTWDGTKVQPTKTDADGNILIENAEQLAWVALEGTTEETKDKNYKVVDGAVFNLNGMTGVTLDSTASEVNDAAATANVWKLDAANRNANGEQQKSFAGNFDGNGVIIYNMYAVDGYSGLFPFINTDNTAKTCNFSNITVKASYIDGYHFAAAIIGSTWTQTTSQFVNITGCKVENSYVNSVSANSACEKTAALLIAATSHCKTTIDSCIAVNNIVKATDIKGGFIGNTSAYAGDAIIKNSVVIGALPYSVQVSDSPKTPLRDRCTKASCYNNIYTDQEVASTYAGCITRVDAADMKGSAAKVNMPSLDWSRFIAFDGEYPDLRTNHTIVTTNTGDASGHKVECSDCGKAMTETHNLVDNNIGTIRSCACGYSEAITDKKTDVWDGSKPLTLAASGMTGDGTEGNPYIVKTAAQLWYIAQNAGVDSADKYYKVANNIGTFDMRNINWALQDNSCYFQGNFDGNGATIINFTGSAWHAALFPNVVGNVTIKNIKLSGASITATGGDAGGLVGVVNGGAATNVVISNSAVENCTVNAKNAAGAVVASAGNGPFLTIDNCFVKGNEVTASTTDTATYKSNSILGLGWKSGNYTVSNSIILGNNPTNRIDNFKNVYTDQVVDTKYTEKQIKTLTVEEMSGEASLDNVAFDYGRVWFANAGLPELQVFHNLKGTTNEDGYSGHSANCQDCGLTGLSGTKHIYDANFKCTVCGFACDHQNDEYKTVTDDKDGDCVTAPNTKTECECGYVNVEYHGSAKGHKLVKTEAKEATCIADGNIEYYTCEECGNIFLTDDKMAAMNTAITQEETVITATKTHLPIEDSNGEIIFGMSGQKHWKICKYCGCEFDKTSHEVEYDNTVTVGHKGKCTVCLYEVHDYADVNEKGKPIQVYDEAGHWYNCNDCGKAEYAEHTLETDETVEGVYQWCEDDEGNSCGYEIFNYSLQSDDGLVTVTGSENVFSKDVITDIFKVSADETLNYDEIKAIFEKEGHKNFAAYDFSPSEEIAEGGSITLEMVVGDIYGSNATIYYADTEKGTLEKITTKIEEVKDENDDVTYVAVATITETGLYAVAVNEVISVGDDDTNTGYNDDLINNGSNAGVNGDTSSTSPATKTQNVASAAVVAVLSAATIVFARKIKKS